MDSSPESIPIPFIPRIVQEPLYKVLKSSYPVFRYDLVQETVDTIVREFNPKKIIIFGSVAKGTADDHSDLDILVVMDTDERYYRRLSKIHKSFCKVRTRKISWS